MPNHAITNLLATAHLKFGVPKFDSMGVRGLSRSKVQEEWMEQLGIPDFGNPKPLVGFFF